MNAPPRVSIFPIVFFLSGCAALIFETVWFRVAGLSLGSSVWSAAAVLTAFMAGLGIGNWLMAFYGRLILKPVNFYIICEIAIGITGVLSIYILPLFPSAIANHTTLLTSSDTMLTAYRFITSFSILLIPTIAMGCTLPLLQKSIHKYFDNFSTSLGLLYGWNTLGAVAGALISELVLIKYIGLNNAALFACALNFIAAYALIRYSKRSSTSVIEKSLAPDVHQRIPISLLTMPFLTGLLLLALEVVWFRYMLLSHIGTSNIFSIMLAVVLMGIGLGGLLVAKLKIWNTITDRLLLIFPILAGITVTASFYLFHIIVSLYPDKLFESLFYFSISAFILMLPTSVISGALFPLYGEKLYRSLGNTTKTSGLLTLSNTMGAAIGSAVAIFVLLPNLGIEASIALLAIAYFFVAFLAIYNTTTTKNPLISYIAVAMTALIVVLIFPFGSVDKLLNQIAHDRYPGNSLVDTREGLNSTLQYIRKDYLNKPVSHKLLTNSYSMSDTTYSAKRYMKLYAYFPYILKNNIQDVLQISYGVGNTAEAITNINSVKHFDVVDISPDILEMSTIVHKVSGKFPLLDSRTHIHLEDGRFFLQITGRQYDLITGEPPPPKIAKVVNLYTAEYFQLIKSKLKKGGMVTYWLPAHNLIDHESLSIIKSFCMAFTNCSLWNGSGMDFMLIGTNGDIQPTSSTGIKRAWNSEISDDLKRIGMEDITSLGSLFMADSNILNSLTTNIPPLLDNYPHRISTDFTALGEYSKIYEFLLDTNRRKHTFSNSDFIRSIFDDDMIQATLNNFRFEDNYIFLFSPQYTNHNYDYWDALLDILKNSSFEVLPLLMLKSSPEEQDINLTTKDTSNIIYQYSTAKYLLATRRYHDAATAFQSILYNTNTHGISSGEAY
ncbi:MAG: fused MFS/spermidine synthase, partial [Gammaproteobacteria bacterium]|nr:fused MFS/spermidine synthase [Gammaproteobacteria bacterium]